MAWKEFSKRKMAIKAWSYRWSSFRGLWQFELQAIAWKQRSKRLTARRVWAAPAHLGIRADVRMCRPGSLMH